MNMKEQSTDLLKYLGGPTQFTCTNTKIEWVEDDGWNRRVTGCTMADHAVTETLTFADNIAHRFPIGTLFYNNEIGETARLSAHVSASTVTLLRDTDGQSKHAAWLATHEVLVAGLAMHETDYWTFSPGAYISVPYNFVQTMSEGVHVTFNRMEQALLGIPGTDLDYLTQNVIARAFVNMEQNLITGYRYLGASTKPSLMGGINFYVTAANGAYVKDLADAALTRKDLDDALQDRWVAVGPEKVARTVLLGPWAKRKVSSWFSSAEHMNSGAGQTGGITVDRINTDFGPVDFLLHTAIAQDQIYFLNRENIKMGVLGARGRPHLEIPAGVSPTAPRVERFFYAAISCEVKGVQGMGRITDISETT
jgi:hypothetical protein